jgi:hypothetical protein
VEGTEQPHHDDYVYAVRDEEAFLQGDHEKQQVVEPLALPQSSASSAASLGAGRGGLRGRSV